jgi:hypothetical protein
MRNSSLSLIVATLFLVALSGTARAEIFTAYLNGAQEAPPIATTATGWARVTVNETTGSLQFIVFFQGLSSNQILSHIHAPAAIGASTGVAINFGVVGGTTGTISGTTTITPTQLSQLRAGLAYVNVHSANFTGGEIRGQLAKQRPVDYDGDGRTDMSILAFPNIGPPGVADITWWNLNSFDNSVLRLTPWGDANRDFPAPGDYDGDARGDIAYYRTNEVTGQNEYWIIQSSTFTVRYFAWGVPNDQTVQRDYDGDGITDVAIVRPGVVATDRMTWYIRNSSTGTARVEEFGITGNGSTSFDAPVPCDYDGDGKFDLAMYRFGVSPANTYIIRRSSDSAIEFRAFGNFNTDYIVPGDYDADGKCDLAVARTGAVATSPLVWWIQNSSNGSIRVNTFGRTSDFPAQGDYDGDSRTDIAIYRGGATATAQSFYWINNSFTNTPQVTAWGLGADFSVNTFDIR